MDDSAFVSVLPEISEEVREYVDDMATGLRAEGFNVTVTTPEGSPREIVGRMVKDEPRVLTALMTRGLTGVSRILAGSVAEAAIRSAAGPVLVMPPTAS